MELDIFLAHDTLYWVFVVNALILIFEQGLQLFLIVIIKVTIMVTKR